MPGASHLARGTTGWPGPFTVAVITRGLSVPWNGTECRLHIDCHIVPMELWLVGVLEVAGEDQGRGTYLEE